MPSRTERRRNSFGTWQVLLVIVLALLLVGAKGCKKKKQGVYKAQTASGDVYWYYAEREQLGLQLLLGRCLVVSGSGADWAAADLVQRRLSRHCQ